jgi:hypothetical protein
MLVDKKTANIKTERLQYSLDLQDYAIQVEQ